jgi:hypothetical protein
MALGIAVSLVSSGCSLLFVDGPSKAHEPSWKVRCTTSYALPVFDSVLAGLEAVRTGCAVSRRASDYKGSPISQGFDITAGISLFLLTSVSSGFGFSRVGDCREALGPYHTWEVPATRRKDRPAPGPDAISGASAQGRPAQRAAPRPLAPAAAPSP